MNSASDWRHIQPDDVDLVLCRNPFGNYVYDDNKASCMLDLFDDILGAVEASDGENNFDFVIVTNEDCLPKDRKVMAHKLMKEGVKLTHTTTDAQLSNLSGGVVTQHRSNHCCKGGDFFKYMTSTILDNYSNHIASIDQAKLEEARELLKRHRMVAISGPAKSGKTSISVALAKSYRPDEVLFLHSPDNISSIDFHTTLLVVIEDFGGKYRFDWMEVNKWLACFDLLHEAHTAGKLNVVVTCETKKLQNCIKEIPLHPLLFYQVQLTTTELFVKPEPSKNGLFSVIPRGSNSSNPLPGTSVGESRDAFRSVQSVREYSVRIHDERSCSITGCCTLPGCEILLVDGSNNRLKKLDSAYNVISVCGVCDLPVYPYGVCYIGNNVAVVIEYKQLVYVDVSSMTVRNTVTTEYCCYSITCHNDQLYVMSDDTVYTYTLDSNNWSTLYKIQNNFMYIGRIAVSGDGNRIYITDGRTRLITIDSFGKRLNSLTIPGADAVCVDDRDNVWVAGMEDNKLYQVSADGARLLDTVYVDKLNTAYALCYDRDRSSLIAGGESDIINVIRLY